MKSVLMSIQPKWCELIANGKKTIEIRKTKPKGETPFKVYIYCTSVDRVNLEEYTRIHLATNGRIDDWHGKVMGEFVCDRIIHYEMEGYGKDLNLYQSIKAVRFDEDGEELWFTIATNEMTEAELSKIHLLNKSCLSFDQIGNYVVGNKMFGFHSFYGWHISDLEIYDEPKELSEFRYYNTSVKIENGYPMPTHELKKAPQSWCYVEALKGGGE